MNIDELALKERERYFNQLEKRYIRKRRERCSYCDCSEDAINSHTTSKSFYVREIAEDNKVGAFVPKRNGENKELTWEMVGINKASIFPGFCHRHDSIFNSIDVNGIRTNRDLLLQCYRTVCFWYYYEKRAAALLGAIQDDVDDTMRNRTRLLPHLGLDYDQLRFGGDFEENKFDAISPLLKMKTVFEGFIHVEDSGCLSSRILLDGMEIRHVRVGEFIPVIMNTMTTIKIGQEGNVSDLRHVFNIVLPKRDATDIIMIDTTQGALHFEDAWKARTSNMLNIISLIESWMIMDENWYIQPSIIERLPSERMRVIADDLRYAAFERELWEPYDVSIFDDLRRKYLKEYDAYLDDERRAEENSRFFLPHRDDRAKREEVMRRDIARQQMYHSYSYNE